MRHKKTLDRVRACACPGEGTSGNASAGAISAIIQSSLSTRSRRRPRYAHRRVGVPVVLLRGQRTRHATGAVRSD